MSRAIQRRRALRADDVIGAVIASADGWTYEPAGRRRVPLEWFATEEEAEQALRDFADRTRGEHILAAGFIGLLATHPVLYAATALA